MTSKIPATKKAVRAARLAPLAALRMQAPKMIERGLRNALVALPARGLCAETARRMSLTRYSTETRAAALRSPSCPPGVIRAASDANNDLREASADAAGAAAWRSRSLHDTLPPHKPRKDYDSTGPDIPPSALRWLGLHGDVYGDRSSALANPACPPAMRTSLCEEISGNWIEVPFTTSGEPHDPKWPAAAVAVFASSPFPNIRWAAAADPACPSVAIKHLAEDDDRDVRVAAAANPACPPAQVASAAAAEDFELNAAACKNPALAPAAQARLAAGDNPRTRSMIATNTACSPPLLEQLARDPSAAVRAAAADNPALPAAALTELATGDPDRRVRLAAHTRHPPTAEILHSAARDSSRKIRAIALAHPDCLPEDLAHAATSAHQPTRSAALAHPGCPPKALAAAAASHDRDTRSAALAHPGCPSAAVAQAAAHPDPDTKIRALRHLACPHAVLDAAARSPEQIDRRAVASRESCPPLILATIVHTETGPDPYSVEVPPPDPDITFHDFCGGISLGGSMRDDDTGGWRVTPSPAQMALSHKDCPSDVLGVAARSTRHRFFGPASGNPACPPEDLAAAVTSWGFDGPYLAVRAAVRNPACPPHILAAAAVHAPKRSGSGTNWVRRIAAANPACPPQALEQLAEDPDPETAKTAIMNLNYPPGARSGAVLALLR